MGVRDTAPADPSLEAAAQPRDRSPLSCRPRPNSSSAFSARPRSMLSHGSASKIARASPPCSKTRVREALDLPRGRLPLEPSVTVGPVSATRNLGANRSKHNPQSAGAEAVAVPRQLVRVLEKTTRRKRN